MAARRLQTAGERIELPELSANRKHSRLRDHFRLARDPTTTTLEARGSGVTALPRATSPPSPSLSTSLPWAEALLDRRSISVSGGFPVARSSATRRVRANTIGRERLGVLVPESAMDYDGFCFEYRSDDENTGLFRSPEGFTAREEEVVRFDDPAQCLRGAAVDD